MLPELVTEVPGPESRRWAGVLRAHESRNVTWISGEFPVFWERAEGPNIWDVDGNRYLDLNGGFGVVLAGWGAPHLVEALREQAGRLYHGMGDVHPSRLKAELCRELSRVTFERLGAGPGKVILGCAGFEAVEAALKTARLATGRAGVLAFHGGYHGLGYGAMTVTGMEKFRRPFADQTAGFAAHAPYPRADSDPADWQREWERCVAGAPPAGAVLVEPVLGRGGEVIPPRWFLPALRRWCDERGALLICDEIYTGMFRTGRWLACEHDGVVPDLVCLGKGLSGAYPISACVGRAEVMDAWPESDGEALHTSTFLGNPLGCAAALASLRFWGRAEVQAEVARLGAAWGQALAGLAACAGVREVRGRGMLWAVEFREAGEGAWRAVEALRRGLILLPAGQDGRVLSIKPSLAFAAADREGAVAVLKGMMGGGK